MPSHTIRLQSSYVWTIVSNNSIFVYDNNMKTVIRELRSKKIIRKVRTPLFNCICMCPKGKNIVMGNFTGLYLWDVCTGITVCQQRQKHVTALAISSDGQKVAVAYFRDKVQVKCSNITIYDNQLVHSLTQFELATKESVRELTFSFNGKYLAASLSNNYVFIWGIDGQYISKLQLRGYWNDFVCLAFSPVDLNLATLNGIGLRIWNTDTLKPIYGKNEGNGRIIYSPNGKHIFRAHRGVQIIDIATNRIVDHLLLADLGFIFCLILSPNYKYIIVIGNTSHVKILRNPVYNLNKSYPQQN